MAVGDAAGAAGLTTYSDSLLVTDVDVALNQRGDDVAATMTRLAAVEKSVVGTPMFSVTRSSNGQTVPASTYPAMGAGAWASPVINRGGFGWSGGVLTVPRAGVYSVAGHVHFYNDDFTTVAFQVTRNTTNTDTTNTVVKAEWSGATQSGETAISPSASGTRLFVPLNAGDLLRFFVLQRNVNNQTWNTGPNSYDLVWDVLWQADL